jgi:SAM-dependent methyltransferase
MQWLTYRGTREASLTNGFLPLDNEDRVNIFRKVPLAALDELYSKEFFAGRADGSIGAASVVVPMVLALLEVGSVVDVGCGLGAWAAEFLANGVPEAWGIDGNYVDRAQLRIPLDRFLPGDLTQPIQFDRTVDLVVCLEVAEHLPESRAASLIADLVSLAPCILFSAALPGQGGTNHINEQYLSYWIRLFEEQGYEGIDPLRPQILGNDLVDWWYQQNIVMFVAPGHGLLKRNFPKPSDLVHPRLYHLTRTAQPPLRKLISELPGAVRRSIRFRLGF